MGNEIGRKSSNVDLIYAAKNGDSEKVRRLAIGGRGNDVDYRSVYHLTALMEAAEHDKVDCVELLLSEGAKVDLLHRKGHRNEDFAFRQWSALMLASFNGFSQSAKKLLDFNANVDLSNEEGENALLMAALKGHLETATLLLDYGADVNHMDDSGNSALTYSISNGNESMLNLLLSRGVDVNLVNKRGQSALMLACKRGRGQQAKSLLEHGADVTLTDKYGKTALHYSKGKVKRLLREENNKLFA